MSLQNWVADNRAFPSLLPKPRVATKADLARPNTHEPETLRQPGGPATHCYLCCEEWRDHLTNEEEEEDFPMETIHRLRLSHFPMKTIRQHCLRLCHNPMETIRQHRLRLCQLPTEISRLYRLLLCHQPMDTSWRHRFSWCNLPMETIGVCTCPLPQYYAHSHHARLLVLLRFVFMSVHELCDRLGIDIL